MSASTPSFLSTIRALFSSRKYLVFVVTLAVAIGAKLGIELDDKLVLGILLLGGALAGFIAWEDVAAKSGSVIAPFDDADIELPATIEDELRAELRQAQEEIGRLNELLSVKPPSPGASVGLIDKLGIGT